MTFEANKESKHILSLEEPQGGNFKILGVEYDCELSMEDACIDLVNACNWKVASLLKTRRFHTPAYLLGLYKAQLLGFVEYRTSAIYHATRKTQEPLDNVQRRFLKEVGVSEVDALLTFNLAPLETRRDMAMLAVIHRAVLRKGPPHLQKFFKLDTRRTSGHARAVQLPDFGAGKRLLKRTVLGLIPVYNKLPERVATANTVKGFQQALQDMVKQWAAAGAALWQRGLSPRDEAKLVVAAQRPHHQLDAPRGYRGSERLLHL